MKLKKSLKLKLIKCILRFKASNKDTLLTKNQTEIKLGNITQSFNYFKTFLNINNKKKVLEIHNIIYIINII